MFRTLASHLCLRCCFVVCFKNQRERETVGGVFGVFWPFFASRQLAVSRGFLISFFPGRRFRDKRFFSPPTQILGQTFFFFPQTNGFFPPTQILGQTFFFFSLPRRFWDRRDFFSSHADSGTNWSLFSFSFFFFVPRRFWDKRLLFFVPRRFWDKHVFSPLPRRFWANGFFPSHADSGTMTKAASVGERRLSRLAGRAAESRSTGFEPRVPSSLL